MSELRGQGAFNQLDFAKKAFNQMGFGLVLVCSVLGFGLLLLCIASIKVWFGLVCERRDRGFDFCLI